ncbi:hypothetical protein THAOC_09385 [Thalassiosira oceanica]|uniref:Uncharacterized protein n=1 Tax=Thalassiosira oceanica TaxID=159749 RepID=K0T7Q3_THAOC|nr:hypothetical protein THAOC_09385 [Thalassiosira oceanica]|eukprot:EJK69366.1 hypothetical protein THAOC_09385 [Thalassiosira oceanica]
MYSLMRLPYIQRYTTLISRRVCLTGLYPTVPFFGRLSKHSLSVIHGFVKTESQELAAEFNQQINGYLPDETIVHLHWHMPLLKCLGARAHG